MTRTEPGGYLRHADDEQRQEQLNIEAAEAEALLSGPVATLTEALKTARKTITTAFGEEQLDEAEGALEDLATALQVIIDEARG